MNRNKYHWAKQQLAPDYQLIDCPAYDPIKDFKRDPSGCYLLIRVNREEGDIEVAICTAKHVITHVFRGKTPQELYHTILTHEKNMPKEWFKAKDHLAYLGKEFKKAELALLHKAEYVQE